MKVCANAIIMPISLLAMLTFKGINGIKCTAGYYFGNRIMPLPDCSANKNCFSALCLHVHHNDDRAHYDDGRAQYDDGRGHYDDDRAHHNDNKANHNDDKAHHNDDKAHHNGDKTHHNDDKVHHNDDKTHHNDDKWPQLQLHNIFSDLNLDQTKLSRPAKQIAILASNLDQ
uniref:Uncharacterized protein n=1 Tax=Globodera rostochiensis TaxID=31243 RepID=A0A914ICR1_GLORO